MDHEMPCGCVTLRSGVNIRFCSLHAAAQEVLSALVALMDLSYPTYGEGLTHQICESAVAKSQGRV